MPQTTTLSPDGALTAPVASDTLDTLTRWQSHLDAGRIGTRRPASPRILANRANTDALIRAQSAATRAALASGELAR